MIIIRILFQILSYLSIVIGLGLGILFKNLMILGLGIIFCVTFQIIAFSILWKKKGD